MRPHECKVQPQAMACAGAGQSRIHNSGPHLSLRGGLLFHEAFLLQTSIQAREVLMHPYCKKGPQSVSSSRYRRLIPPHRPVQAPTGDSAPKDTQQAPTPGDRERCSLPGAAGPASVTTSKAPSSQVSRKTYQLVGGSARTPSHRKALAPTQTVI